MSLDESTLTQQIRDSYTKVSDSAERVGYARAVVDLMEELDRRGFKDAAVAVALFCKAKGIFK